MAGFFNAQAEEVASHEATPVDPLAAIRPRMVTSLKLTPDQESRLVNRALERINDLEEEMGRKYSEGGNFVEGWMWRRQKNQLQYDNEWAWREALGGIFEFSNFSLNLSKRYARLMAAKVSDDLVGTDPFFSCMPTERGDPRLSAGDALLAKQAEWYLQDKISQSNAKKALKSAQRTALIRNECVSKLSWVSHETHYRGPGRVAVGPFRYATPQGDVITQEGEPIMTPKGEYIYEHDDLFDDPNVQGVWRLEKEPTVSSEYELQFADFEELEMTLHGETGLRLDEVDYRDFLCPLNAASVHEADINVHLFDEEWARMKATYTGFEVSKNYCQASYVAGAKQPKLEQGEVDSPTRIVQFGNYADVYMRCNPFEGDQNDPGRESEVWMIIDLNAKTAVFYDYMANHMEKRPFEVIPGVEFVQNRWYGVGVFEMLQHKQDYVDTQFNRVNWASTKASGVRFRNVNAVEQWAEGAQMEFGDDQVYDIKDPKWNAQNPPYFEVAPREINQDAMHLIELMLQAGSTEVGIVGPDDGAMSGLDTTKLATGIKSLERTGNLLMKWTETDHAEAIMQILDQMVECQLEHMDASELTFRRDTGSLMDLNVSEIRRLRTRIKMLLTRSRSTDTIETMRAVVQLIREYYEALSPLVQYYAREEYVRQMKALEVPDAEQKLREVTWPEVLAWQKAQAEAANLPPKTSIATKFGDLARPEQEQVLQKEGIVPATAEQLKADNTDKADQEGEIAGAKAKEEAKFAPKSNAGSSKKAA